MTSGRQTPAIAVLTAVALLLIIGVAAAVGLGGFRLTSASAPNLSPSAAPVRSPAATFAATVTTPPTTPPTGTVATPPPPPPGTAAARRPQGYVLPGECQYVDNGTVDGSATTWKISCPQGLPSNYLRPSLEAQGWISCSAKVWRKDALQIAITDAVNVSGFSGWLDQRSLSGSGCVQPPPPPNTP